MTGPRGWPSLRQHGRHCAAPPDIKETPVPSSLAASLPGPMPRSLERPILAGGSAAEPLRTLQCGFCHVIGPSSLISDIAGQIRCNDDQACVQRWAEGGQPRPLVPFSAPLVTVSVVAPEPAPQPEPEDAPPELPPAQEAALVRFNAATDEQDAAEKAAREPEAGEPAEPVTEDAEPVQDDTPAPVAEPEPAPPVAEGSAPAQNDPAEDQ